MKRYLVMTCRTAAQGTGVRVLSICPTSVTDGGAYDRLMKDIAANGNHARCVMMSSAK